MGWGKVGYMGLGKDEDMMVNPCLPIVSPFVLLSGLNVKGTGRD